MKKGRTYVFAALVSLGTYALLDVTLAWTSKDLFPALWARQHRQKFRIRDYVYHHTLAPSVSVVDRWGRRYYPLATNDLGFRDSRPRQIQLSRSGRRFLFIGDSFTEGQGVSWEESFVGRIEVALKSQEIEVLNAGVSSYGPAIYYAKVRHFVADRGLSVDHVFVFVDISDVKSAVGQFLLTDEGRVVGRFEPLKPDPFFARRVVEWLKRNTITVAFIYKLRDFLSYQGKMRAIADANTYTKQPVDLERLIEITEHNADARWCFPNRASAQLPDFDVATGVKLVRERMTSLHEFLTERGIGLSLVIYPWPSNIQHEIRRLPCESVWQNWAENRGVDLINLFDVFMSGGDPMEVIRRYYITYDVHWNADGHALVAKTLLERMLKAGLSTNP